MIRAVRRRINNLEELDRVEREEAEEDARRTAEVIVQSPSG